MKKIVFSMAVSLLLFILLPAPVIGSPAPVELGQEPALQALGLYEVSVFKNGQWQQVGSLEYNKFLQEKKIDLGRFVPTGKNIKLKLTQKGGGAAHIDTATLNGLAPDSISGAQDAHALKKISKRDFDVIDSLYKTLEITFKIDESSKDKVLHLTARVEPAHISKAPFKFPTANLFKPINQNAQYYSYRLAKTGANSSAPQTPFFREYCRTGSGHPSGFTYGWVHNDAENLYVKIDFTPDNTRDGDKDYARLHVKTPKGIKNFKISESQTQWGQPEFTYTDTVSYQHKTYKFKIPLAELGINKPEAKDDLLLAFTAYGTAAPAAWDLVAAGQNTTVVIGTNGTIWSAGENRHGELGVGTFTTPIDHLTPETNGDTTWYEIANGSWHTLGLKTDGSLWAWGWNNYDQLGDGTGSNQHTPVTLPIGGTWDGIAGGEGHSVGLRTDGTIWSWGLNGSGQLGINSNANSTIPVALHNPTGMGDETWTAVAAGHYHTVALRSDGTIWAWGFNGAGQLGNNSTVDSFIPVRVSDPVDMDPKTWTSVSAAGWVTVARRSDGTIWAWGSNKFGQFGNNSTVDSSIPVQEANEWTDWAAVDTNISHTVGLRTDGTIWTWGNNAHGQLGDGSVDDSSTPVQVAGGDTDWIEVSAGSYHTAAIKTDGTLYTWGRNSEGQLADFTLTEFRVPHPVGAPSIIYGYVTDVGGTGLNGVNLYAHNRTLNQNYSATTNESTTNEPGYYEFTKIPWGCYDLDVDAWPDPSPNIDEEFYLGIAEEKVVDDFVVNSGDLTLDVVITYDGNTLSSANVSVFSEILGIHHYSNTVSSGHYEIPNLPAGDYVIRVEHSLTDYAYYGQKINIAVDPAYPDDLIITHDISLAPEARVIGSVVDPNNQPVTNAWVEFDNDLYEIGMHSNVDANGVFTIENLPEGISSITVHPDIGTGLCSTGDHTFFIAGGGTIDLGNIALQRCALVQGYVTGDVPESFCETGVESEGLSFSADGQISEDGSYALRIPEGTYRIYLDPESDSPYDLTAYPVEVTVTADDVASGTPVIASDMVMITASSSDKAQVSGSVIKVNPPESEPPHPDPIGRVLVLLLPGGHLDNVTPESLMNVNGIQEAFIPSFTAFESDTIPYVLDPVPPTVTEPPTVPPRTYDIFLVAVNKGPGGRDNITVLDLIKNIEIDLAESETIDDLTYEYGGLKQISGVVLNDIPGGLVVGALVMVTDANGDLVAFTETDEKGAYTLYNLPAGQLTVQASHPDWVSHQRINFDISEDSTIAPLTLNHPQRLATPGIDIISGSSGVITWTTNSDNPHTGLILEAKIVDYDGIAEDGSSHEVDVVYPGGNTIKILDLQYVNSDGISAYYDLYDGDFDPASYSGQNSVDFTFRVRDTAGNSSEAIDNLYVAPVNPPDEDGDDGSQPPIDGFSVALDPAQSIRAYFDDVCPYDANGEIIESQCDDFNDGTIPSDYNPYPANVYPNGNEVVIEHMGSLGRAPTWLNTNNIPQDGGPLDFKATVQLDGAGTTSDEPMARIAGNFCRVGDSDIFAMVGIRSEGDAVFAVVKTRWEGAHFIVENIVDVTSFGSLSANLQDYRYDIRLQWDGASIFNFFVVGLDDDSVAYQGSVDLNDHFDPLTVAAPQNAWAGMGVATWNRLNTTPAEFHTTPAFNWSPVTGATYYRVRIYGLNNTTIYRGYTKSPPFRIPPGILKPNAVYKYRIEAIGDHQWFEWDNVGSSNRDLTVFITGPNEAQAPSIDLSSTGVETWTDPAPYGANTWFYVKVHDAQGVPDNIASVKVSMPGDDSTEVDLYLDSTEGPNTGVYRGVYFGDIVSGDLYRFTVRDKDGHENQQPIPIEEDEENNENLDSIPIVYPPEGSLVPFNYDTVGDTQVTFNWDDVSDIDGGAAFYQLSLYDKNFNHLFNVMTENSDFSLPPGLLRENSLYKYRIITRREFFEDNIDNGATVPPFSAGNSNDFITTPTYGSNPPSIDATVSDGVAVWQAPSHVSDDPVYWLEFFLKVEDLDGVPENIQKVEVTYPDGVTKQVLKYNVMKRWNAETQQNEVVANYFGHKIYTMASQIQDATNPSGTYTFEVWDFDGSPVATFTDDLPDVASGLLDWPDHVTPIDGRVVSSTTPTIAWDAVDGAGYYKVRIMSAWNYPTVHWSGKLPDTQYTVPAQVLSEDVLSTDTTYGFRVYAYRGTVHDEVDFYAGNSSRQVANQRFTVGGQDSDGDRMDDAWEVFYFGDLTQDGNGNSDTDSLTDLEEFQNGTDPLNPDTDDDGANDDSDNCPDVSNTDQENSDSDALGDACDNCPDDDNPAAGDCPECIDTIDNLQAAIAAYLSETSYTELPSYLELVNEEGFVPEDGVIVSYYATGIEDYHIKTRRSQGGWVYSLDGESGGPIEIYWKDRIGDTHAAGQPDYDLDGIGDVCDTSVDSDGDGLSDNNEVNVFGTDPTNPDSDGDGRNDGREVDQATNPNDDTEYIGIPDAERTALIALYTSTNGDGWTNNSGWKDAPQHTNGFAEPGTECNWYGVTCTGDHVTAVSLINNQLVGNIPVELSNLTNLQKLALLANQLTGTIPPELGNLANLRELNLSENPLTGNIPTEFGNLTNIERLYLHLNQLTGSIPTEIGSLTNLQSLDLQSNQLTGSIPAELRTLENLQSLYLSNNQLTGNIPVQLGILTNLQHLHLNNNQLEGSIPGELGNLTVLEALYLDDNQLTGSIPTELGKLINLQELNLGVNLLTGNIPAALGSLTGLVELDLDTNKLSGNIPMELGSLSSLQELNLDDNQLTGTIPTQLGNLANLWMLNLWGNQLSGPIPDTLNLNNLKLLTSSDIRWNALYTTNDGLLIFLNTVQDGGDWESTQTVAPTDITFGAITDTTVELSWTPIQFQYTANDVAPSDGGYEVYHATDPAGPYTYFETTADKTVTNTEVTYLNPNTTYHFRLRTKTDPHGSNQNTVFSEFTAHESEATMPAADVAPPYLVNLIFAPTLINVGTAGQDVDFTWTLTDNQSGVATCSEGFSPTQLRLKSQSGRQFRDAVVCAENWVSGDLNNGVFISTVTFPQYSESGVWEIEYVLLVDAAGNSQFLSTADLISRGINTQISVAGVQDVSPPELVNLTFAPTAIDLSATDRNVVFTWTLTDNLGGVATCSEGFSPTQLRLKSPSGQQFRDAVVCAGDWVSGDFTNGVFESTVTFPQDSETGVWQIENILIIDALGNSQNLNSNELISRGISTRIYVGEGSPPDSDGDGIFDYIDNCPDDPNSEQEDSGGNGIGDACECYPDLANPDLDFTGIVLYEPAEGPNYIRYHLKVSNYLEYPIELFVPSPYLPPCGSNDNSARTWVDIYDNEGNRIYGYCALASADSLQDFTFSLPLGTAPPESVYIILEDRECNAIYRSNNATIIVPDADGDGIPDFIDPDDDNDGLTDEEELIYNTNPLNPDSDGDAVSDGDEVNVHGTDPNNGDDYPFVPGVMFVDGTDGDDAGSGRSWTYAKATIQAAINAANTNDEIWVREGPYNLTAQINVNKVIHIYGGFAGTETVRNQRDWQTNGTIVVGGGASTLRCFYITADATIDGFTIINGNAGTSSGGGIYNDSCSPIITNCILSGNIAGGYGGGMYNNKSSPTVTNCTFVDNTADAGGGMSNYPQSSPTVTDCTFRNNHARAGGGMHNHGNSSPTVTNCIFTGNVADDDVGGMSNHSGSNAILTNCIFIGNSAGNTVGGIQNAYSHVTLTNCTFSGNTAGVDYGGMWERGNGNSTVTNCIFWGNTPNEITVYQSYPTITYSVVQGGWPGTGNINEDPLFLGHDLSGRLDFRLQYASPGKNAGDNTAVAGLTEDFEGEQRIFNETVDVGADEFVDSDYDQLPDSWERQYFGDLSIDGLSDDDDDGLNFAEERLQYGTDPNVADPIDINPDIPYYVDPVNGTDDDAHGNGTGSRAWMSLHFAVETLNAGSTGTYTLNLADDGTYTYTFASEGEDDAPLVLNQDMVIDGSGAILDGDGDHGDAETPWTTGLILGPGAANVTIRDLTVQNFETGILINSDGGCLTLENITVEQCDTGLKIVDTYQTTVDLTGSNIQSNELGVYVTAGSSNNVIRYGEVSNNSGDGIRVEGSGEVPDENSFEGIQILNNGLNGIIFYDGWNSRVTDCVISGNNNNTPKTGYGGVVLLEGSAAVNWNIIENNGCHGVYAEDILSATPVDATYNWWGAADGPDGVGPGSGNDVSENVIYEPWLGEFDPAIGRPAQPDSDGDGMGDDWESLYGLNPNDPADAADDPDNDGWTNLQESQVGTDPTDEDDYPTPSTFYVGYDGGDDNNIGSPRFPLASLHRAVEIANGMAAGSDIYLAPRAFVVGAGGELDEPLLVHRNVNIIGSGPATVIDAAGATNWETGLLLTAGAFPKLTISDLTLQNFEQAIVVHADGGCLDLQGVTIDSCQRGLVLLDSDQMTVDLADSLISGCQKGVELIDSSNNRLLYGVIQHNVDGIVIDGQSNVIEGLQAVSNSRNGILLSDGAHNQVLYSEIIDNDGSGVAVDTCCATLNWNIIEGNGCWGVSAPDWLNDSHVAAGYNWWGDASGPAGVASGAGDKVTVNVDYEPWMVEIDTWLGRVAPLDTDNDGLGDDFEQQIIEANLTDSIAGLDDVQPEDDFDRDGTTNLWEFQAGSDPTDQNNYPTPTSYYVRYQGRQPPDDANIGSVTFPLATAHRAFELVNGLPDGSYSIFLAAGTYNVAGGEPDTPLVSGQQQVSVYGSPSVLDGAGAATWTTAVVLETGSAHVSFDGVNIVNFETGIDIDTDAGCVELTNLAIEGCGTGVLIDANYMVSVDLGNARIVYNDTGLAILGDSSGNRLTNGVVENNFGHGIVLDGCNVFPDDNVIDGAQISNNERAGVAILGGSGNQVVNSDISGNRTHGVEVLTCCDTMVNWNVIEGNGNCGVYADDWLGLSGHPLDARYNWWGCDDSGPYNMDSNPVGVGDLVSSNVTYRPWLGQTPTPGDSDDDDLSDQWELAHFGSIETWDGDDDPDQDGVSNRVEFEQGSDPNNPVYVSIAAPAESPYYDNTTSISIGGTSSNADTIEVTNETTATTTTVAPNPANGDWNQSVNLAAGSNAIKVTAAGSEGSATATLTVVQDTQAPSVTINDPGLGTEGTPFPSITLTGQTGDDTKIETVQWAVSVSGTETGSGTATPTGSDGSWETWRIADIPLVEDTSGDDEDIVNLVTVTATDIFGNQNDPAAEISILRSANTQTQQEDLSVPVAADPYDLDGDNYHDDDETLCASNFDDSTSVPDNYGSGGSPNEYPNLPSDRWYDQNRVKRDPNGQIITDANGDPISYLWPDCVNPDDDLDGLSDAWESIWAAEINVDPKNPNTDGDETSDGNENFDGDGLVNSEEEAYGTDPTEADTDGDGIDDGVDPNPTIFTNSGFTLEIVDTSDEPKSYADWLPVYGATLEIQARWPITQGPAPNSVQFRLENTSKWAGRAENDPDPVLFETTYPPWYWDSAWDPATRGTQGYYGYDFGLAAVNPAVSDGHSFVQGPITAGNTAGINEDGIYVIYLQSWDYGGRTRLTVSYATYEDTRWLPRGSGPPVFDGPKTVENQIGTAWEFETPAGLAPEADEDVIADKTPTGWDGDEIKNRGEYRGIIYTAGVDGPLRHLRLDPKRNDLFIKHQGYDESTECLPDDLAIGNCHRFNMGTALANAGINVWDITNWGHDATIDKSFYVYYSDGGTALINNTRRKQVSVNTTNWKSTWPGNEWEFILDSDLSGPLPGDPRDPWAPVNDWVTSNFLLLAFDYLGSEISSGYKIRMPLPPVNALIIHHLPAAISDGGITPESEGAIPPNPDDPDGKRRWLWSEKGRSNLKTDENFYGLAATLKIPLTKYFYQRPFLNGTQWTAAGWTADSTPVAVLDPLSQGEDAWDAGVSAVPVAAAEVSAVDGYSDSFQVVQDGGSTATHEVLAGNIANNQFDGDMRLQDKTMWGMRGEPCAAGPVCGELSPFDIDNNGYVELPRATDPHANNNFRQYTCDPDVPECTDPVPYSLERVLQFLITHETIHAMASKTPPYHSSEETGVMYERSNNWKRDNFVSPDFRKSLDVHNYSRNF